jgi:AraC family transcriptional regulator
MNVEIRTFPEMRVAGVRHVGPYDRIGDAFGRVGSIAAEAGLLNDPKARMVAVYHDDPATTPANELRSDAAITIDASASVAKSLTEQIVPAGRYACTVHRGPYTGLPAVWAAMMTEGVPSTGADFAEGPSLEVYLNNPMTTEKKDLLTEIRIPIAGT